MDTDIVEMRMRATRVLLNHHSKAAGPFGREKVFKAKLAVTTAKDKEAILNALVMVDILPNEFDYIFGTVPPEETN